MKYREIGLSNTKNMFEQASKKGFAVPAYNFSNMEQMQSILNACLLSQSPVILQASSSAIKYMGVDILVYMVKGGIEKMKKDAQEKKLKEIPVALHLDHGADFDVCKFCIDSGFSSVMIDGSSLSYEENVKVTKKVVEYAHKFDVTVEGELGVLAGIEDDVEEEVSHYTDPEDVEDFVSKTGVDSLAISIGTSHGAYKFQVEKEEDIPPLRFDILEEIEKRIPNFPIVLHGASTVPQDAVEMINKYGGKISKAFGVPEKQLRKASKLAVCKVNVDSDARLWMTASVRKYLFENTNKFDPRKYLGEARDSLTEMYINKNTDVLGSSNQI